MKYGKKITIKEAKKTIKNIIKNSTPLEVPSIFLWGPPGIGKSSIIKQISKELKYAFQDVRLSLLESIDLRGLPIIKDGETIWTKPVFLPSLDNQEKGILFLDEINLADISVQNAAFQLILDRQIGEYTLPPGWFIIAAGNRLEDNFSITKMPEPLLNRFIHFEIETNIDDFIEYAIQNNFDEKIIAFLKFRPEFLIKLDLSAKNTAFPTPRSWEFANKLLRLNITDISCCVGEEANLEFQNFVKVYEKIPNVEQILQGKFIDISDEELSVKYAFLTAIVLRAKTENLENVLKYILKLKRTKIARSTEFAVYVLKSLFSKFKEEIIQSKLFDEVIKEFQEVIL